MKKWQKDAFQYGLAAVIVIGEFVMLAYLINLLGSVLRNPAPAQTDVALLVQVFGLVMGYHSAFLLVVGYFYGSSKGSSEKNDIISNSTPNTPTKPEGA